MPYQAITRAELRARLQTFWEGKPFWVDDEANRAINEALRDWNQLTGRWRITPPPIQTQLNTWEYGLPSALLYQTRVRFNGLPMTCGAREDLNNGRPRWRSETTISGGGVPTRPTVWVPVTLLIIRIWPADAVGNNDLVVDGVSATPILTSDADFVDLSEADVSVLLGYALHITSLKKGGLYFQATYHYFRDFLAAAGQENVLITTSQAYRAFMGLEHRDLKPLKRGESPVAGLLPAAGGQ